MEDIIDHIKEGKEMKGDYMNKKQRMRHTYEIHAILSAIYCINETTTKDADITKLIEYALFRVYKDSPVEITPYSFLTRPFMQARRI